MILYQAARRLNTKLKQYKKYRAGKVLSPVRRIERVCPPTCGKFVAMTFDDGPCALSFSNREKGLTESLLDSLQAAGATVSFDVIGSTASNYPDTEGQLGAFTWSGVQFDHYPKFDHDALAGAKNQPELVKKILDGGHELTNHGSTHRLFGPMRAVYGSRVHFNTLDEVTGDLMDLHSYIKDHFGYEMKLSRPAHYIDRIPDGSNAYDAYRIMGYNYMAASFDGRGWLPEDTYQQEVEAMVRPLREALEQDPNALNGQIIFQKDGCNMALRAPIEDALPLQLKLLQEYGYRVVSVSELLAISAFEDLPDDHEAMPYVRTLLDAGHIVGYKNNTFQPDRLLTEQEFWLMAAPAQHLRTAPRYDQRDIAQKSAACYPALPSGGLLGNRLLELAMKTGTAVDEQPLKDQKHVRRKDAVQLLAGLVENNACSCDGQSL